MFGADFHAVPPSVQQRFCAAFDQLATMGFSTDLVAVAVQKSGGDEQAALDLCVASST